MSDYERIYDFQSLLKAHKKARLGKQGKREVIEFEMNLSHNLCSLSEELKNGRYDIKGYYRFNVYEPKKRIIHALHYRDRVLCADSNGRNRVQIAVCGAIRFFISETFDFMVDAVFQGYARFSHMEKLRNDTAYTAIHGGTAPSEKVCRDTLRNPTLII